MGLLDFASIDDFLRLGAPSIRAVFGDRQVG